MAAHLRLNFGETLRGRRGHKRMTTQVLTTSSAAAVPRSLAGIIFGLMDGLSGATLGLLFFGGWGVWANSAHGMDIAWQAGIAQGVMSFVVTLTGTTLMKRLFGMPGPLWLRALVASVGALVVIYGLIVGVHLWLGTPEILLTLAPGLPITIVFCCVFVGSMLRMELARGAHDGMPRDNNPWNRP